MIELSLMRLLRIATTSVALVGVLFLSTLADDWGLMDAEVILLLQLACVVAVTYWTVYHPVAIADDLSAIQAAVLVSLSWLLALWTVVPLAYWDLVREDQEHGGAAHGWIDMTSHAAMPTIKTTIGCAAVVLVSVAAVELFVWSRKRFVRFAST